MEHLVSLFLSFMVIRCGYMFLEVVKCSLASIFKDFLGMKLNYFDRNLEIRCHSSNFSPFLENIYFFF